MNLRSDISKPSPIQKIEKVDKRHACSIHLHKLNMYIYSVSVNSGKPRFGYQNQNGYYEANSSTSSGSFNFPISMNKLLLLFVILVNLTDS